MSNSFFHSFGFASAAAVFLFFSSAASAVDADKPASEEIAFVNPVPDEVLDNSRGAFLPLNLTNINSINNLSAASSGNIVNGGMTGSNFITQAAFNNSQGLVNVIQNSGNNVIIQSSTIVNTVFEK